jgi:NAD(P)H-dependent FMN reductase
MKLQIIIGTTRPNRATERVAKWVAAEAKQSPDTTVELIDLADYPMPFLDEPMSPRFNPERKINQVAGNWVSKLAEADAYIFVTPEYNHSISGVLKNALDYVTFELVKKPATAVGHGTVGGARAIMHLKEILSESQAAITPRQVALPGRAIENFDEDGNLNEELKANPRGPEFALKNLLEELKWYSDALAAARAKDK